MTTAYILIKASPGAPMDTLETIRGIKGVKQAHAIMGPHDGIAFVEVADLEELAEISLAINGMDEVASTDTRLAWPF